MLDDIRVALLLSFQAPLLCMIACSYVFVSLSSIGVSRKQMILLRLFSVSVFLSSICEILGGLVLYNVLDINIIFVKVFYNLSYLFMLCNTILLSEFTLSRINNVSNIHHKLLHIMFTLVLIIILARLLLNDTQLFTYFIGEEIFFGPFDDIQTWGCIFCQTITTSITFVKFIDKKEYLDKERNAKLFIANVFVLIVFLIYIFTYIPYIVWMSHMLSLLYIYTSLQRSMIYTDELTKLKNRRKMYKDIKEYDLINKDFTYIMFDINKFKSVNDTYGHNVGDKAIKIVASVIDDISKKYNSDAYRIGGDEFSVLVLEADENLIIKMISEIDNRLINTNKTRKLGFNLSVSSGYAINNVGSFKDIGSVINLADSRMYENKNGKK